LLALAVLWWLAAAYLVLTYPQSSRFWGGSAGSLLIGLLILLPAWQALVLLKQWALGNWLILAVMVLVWVADIGAYFSGKTFGRRKLAPQVSPGKSWEGVVGGLLTSLLVTLAVGIYRGWSARELILALLGAALVVGNTVRLDIQARREEIGVLQLLGASDGFIRRPFVYLGGWYGLGAGAVALGLIGICGLALRAPLTELSQSWLGAWLVTGHFLRQTRPTET